MDSPTKTPIASELTEHVEKARHGKTLQSKKDPEFHPIAVDGYGESCIGGIHTAAVIHRWRNLQDGQNIRERCDIAISFSIYLIVKRKKERHNDRETSCSSQLHHFVHPRLTERCERSAWSEMREGERYFCWDNGLIILVLLFDADESVVQAAISHHSLVIRCIFLWKKFRNFPRRSETTTWGQRKKRRMLHHHLFFCAEKQESQLVRQQLIYIHCS